MKHDGGRTLLLFTALQSHISGIVGGTLEVVTPPLEGAFVDIERSTGCVICNLFANLLGKRDALVCHSAGAYIRKAAAFPGDPRSGSSPLPVVNATTPRRPAPDRGAFP
jgi:hypothetical protein